VQYEVGSLALIDIIVIFEFVLPDCERWLNHCL